MTLEHPPCSFSLSWIWRPHLGRWLNLQLYYKKPSHFSCRDHVTYFLSSYVLLSFCHCNPSLLLSTTGSQGGGGVHVLVARRLARSICRSCVTCRRIAARNETQPMGQLPATRATLSSPFTVTGIEYAGPIHSEKGAHHPCKNLFGSVRLF